MSLMRISNIVEILNLSFEGEDIEVDGLGLCNRNSIHTSILSYVTNKSYVEYVRNNHTITCLVLSKKMQKVYTFDAIGRKISYIISDKPEVCFYNIHEMLCKSNEFYKKFNFESKIGTDCSIDQSVIIEKGVIIGDNVKIGPNSVIKSGSIIEDNSIIGCNTTIGSEGFQVIMDGDNMPMHITHVGGCHIGTNVYIGDNTCICNSLFEGETYIGDGAKIDNLVHIAHNLYVGKNAVITAHVILCGSSRIEEGAWIGPNSSVLNRVVVGKYSKVGLGSVVTRDVASNTIVYGVPAKVHQ